MESEIISKEAAKDDLTPQQWVRHALAYYQSHRHKMRAGETVTYSGDEQRAREFAGTAK